jgi:uncharacterized protein
MSRPGLIDTREFARLGLVLEGRLPVAGLTRLASALCDSEGELSYRLRGAPGKYEDAREDAASLDLEFEVTVRVPCQRCLEPLELPLKGHNRLRLIENLPEWSAETAELDADEADEIVHAQALDVAALIEDEVLLALPWAPRHQHCELANNAANNAAGGRSSKARDSRESPFGVLAQLKKRAPK